jgi:DnaD/phage-associated family protein
MKKTDEEQGKYATEKEDSLNNARAMMGWDRPLEIQDEGDLRKYRIELPNLYDDAGLDPYEFRLLAHYKRVGTCTEGTKTTANKCSMSPMQVSNKRQSLRKKGFIRMQKVDLEQGGYSYRITVVDRWQENFLKYSTVTPHVTPLTHHVLKKEEEAPAETSSIFEVYQNEIGMLTPFIADALEDWEKDIPAKWIADAIHEAAANNKRNWKYVEAILKRWKAQGSQESTKNVQALRPEHKRIEKKEEKHVPNPFNKRDILEKIADTLSAGDGFVAEG